MTDPDLSQRVRQACQELIQAGQPVTFVAVAAQTGVSRATLYRNPELRVMIESHRPAPGEALTLSGLAVQVDQLRHSLEAVAARVRHHEEELRRLTKAGQSGKPRSGLAG
jgi:hypothetical protein